MANTLEITHTEDGRRKVKIKSEGERDMTAVVDRDELAAQVLAADQAQGNLDPAQPEQPADPEPEPADETTTDPEPEKAEKVEGDKADA